MVQLIRRLVWFFVCQHVVLFTDSYSVHFFIIIITAFLLLFCLLFSSFLLVDVVIDRVCVSHVDRDHFYERCICAAAVSLLLSFIVGSKSEKKKQFDV